MEGLKQIERVGALRLLLVLLDGSTHVTQVIRRGFGEEGLGTQNAIKTTRRALLDLGLIEENEQEVALTRTRRIYMRLTDRGRRVAEHVKAIGEILSEE